MVKNLEDENTIKEVKIGKFRMVMKFLKLFLFTLFRTKWFLPGVSEITADELHDRIQANNSPLMVDTRDRVEFYAAEGSWRKYGHIEGARNIPIFELTSKLQDLSSYKDKEIVTFCPGGGMSLVAAEIMVKAGFTDVKSLKGGTDDWDRKGYPSVTGRDLGITLEDIEKMNIENKAVIVQSKKPTGKKYYGKIHKTVDAKNLSCPQPVMMSKKTLTKLEIGQVLEVLATDPGSKRDIPAWAEISGQELISVEEISSKEFRFLVKRLK
jgi:TusA-related sulfurtransferase/rhodanese-related sulfurtransferase